MKVAVTGHRPKKLPGGYSERTHSCLVKVAYNWLSNKLSIEEFYNGGALGWDNASLKVALELNINSILCVPFKGQESRWNPESKRDYNFLLSKVNKVVYVDELDKYLVDAVDPYEVMRGKMQKRNEYMVDQLGKGDILLALFDGVKSGGTWNCIKYAQGKGIEVVNLWDEFNEIYDRAD